MSILLDSHALLWWLEKSPRLAQACYDIIEEPGNTIFVSSLSIAELRIKQAIGKLKLSPRFANAIAKEGFDFLPFTEHHAHQLQNLPLHHLDPFDRMLIAQAQYDSLKIITADRHFSAYDVRVIWA